MSQIHLPHQHNNQNQVETIQKELAQVNKFDGAAKLFKLLGDPTRVRIFWLLSHQEECVLNIATLLDMSSPAVSHHLRSLLDANLITSRRDGKEVFYRAAATETAQLLHDVLEQVMEVACPESTQASLDSPEEIARQIHTYLMDHLHERITIEELSKKFLINTTTLKEAFKNVYGTSLAMHMKEHRMERASKMLQETEQNVGEIALAVGYKSQSRFTTAFKEIYGMVPTEYRKSSR